MGMVFDQTVKQNSSLWMVKQLIYCQGFWILEVKVKLSVELAPSKDRSGNLVSVSTSGY